MTRIEDIKALVESLNNSSAYSLSVTHLRPEAIRDKLSWLVKMVERMQPLLQRGFSGTEHARKMAKCNPQLYEENGWPIPCSKCDTCLTRALLIDLKEEK